MPSIPGRMRSICMRPAFSRECVDGGCHREVRLARSGRSDPDDDVVVLNLSQILALPWRLRLNDPSYAGKSDALQIAHSIADMAVVVIVCLAAIDRVAD